MNEGNGRTKGRLIFLAKYLMDQTDDQNTVTVEDLIQICKEQGYTVNRNTLRDDIAILSSADIDIIAGKVGKSRAYHVGSRLFEIAELRTLVDAVSSCRFISRDKSNLLIDKLSCLTNVQNRQFLQAEVFCPDYIKSDSTGIFVIIDIIRASIERKRKISFHYWDYAADKRKVLRHNGELYIASPYNLIWNNDRYYLAAYSEKREKVVTFRLDRMCDVSILEEAAILKKAFNPSEYVSKSLNMFDGNGEETEVVIQSKNQYMQSVIDRFGEYIRSEILDSDNFLAWIMVHPSRTFFSWVFQFQGEIKIVGPAKVRREYENMLLDVWNVQRATNAEYPHASNGFTEKQS